MTAFTYVIGNPHVSGRLLCVRHHGNQGHAAITGSNFSVGKLLPWHCLARRHRFVGKTPAKSSKTHRLLNLLLKVRAWFCPRDSFVGNVLT